MPDALSAPTHSFDPTISTRRTRQRHASAPGCALCTILIKLEDARPIDQDAQTITYTSNRDQPPSPATASPSVAQNPFLSANAMRNSVNGKTVDGRMLVVDDDDLTGWIASSSECLASDGRHAVIVFKRHVEDVYAFVSLLFIVRFVLFPYPVLYQCPYPNHQYVPQMTDSHRNSNLSSRSTISPRPLGPRRHTPPSPRFANSPCDSRSHAQQLPVGRKR